MSDHVADASVDARDVVATGDYTLGFLTPLASRDWSAPVPDLEWNCELTLRHMIFGQSFYAAHLATRSPRPLQSSRDVTAGLSIEALLDILGAQVSILAAVIRDAPPGARSWHISGMTDAGGYSAMSCDELLVHSWDLARGFDEPFVLPEELCARIVARLFPMWAPIAAEPRDAFLWCNGRVALPDRPRQDGNWGWWSSPLEDFDGADPDRLTEQSPR
jgi:uncharacterized protein (TIGR03083 family)